MDVFPRREALARLAALAASAGLASCGRRDGANSITLYSSVDDHFLREVVAAFGAAGGAKVFVVGDTEATKTTGLVQRLLAEKDRPRADVWWSSEPFGTIRLAGEGILEPYTSAAEADFPGGWPPAMRGAGGLWYGFASRARVIVYNTAKVAADAAPSRLADLTGAAWRGRVGMARPQFGTTRGQMAMLHDLWGRETFEAWLRGLKDSGLRLYDGNSAVVRGVAYGEIDIGLTDTDDVWSGQRNGWPVALRYEARDPAATPPSPGPMPIPNTVAKVRGGANPGGAAALIDFLLSERVERLLASSDSGNTPLRPALAAEFADRAIPDPAVIDLARVAAAVPAAMEVCDAVLG